MKITSSEVSVHSVDCFGELGSEVTSVHAGVASDVIARAGGIARITTGVATAIKATFKEILQATTGLVEQATELASARGIAVGTGIAGSFIAGIASGIVVATKVASTSTRIIAARATTAKLETAEQVLELELRNASGVTSEVVARIATIGIAQGVARINIASHFIARIAALVGEEPLQPLAEAELPATVGVATEVAATSTRITFEVVARRAGHNAIARATVARGRLAGCQIFETGKQVTNFGTTITCSTRITCRITGTAIAGVSPGAHQQGEDESGHHHSGLHWVNSPFPGFGPRRTGLSLSKHLKCVLLLLVGTTVELCQSDEP